MEHPHIFYKSDKTGGAWYHYRYGMEFTFENNCIWKIYGIVYVANTGRFRDVWDQVMLDTTWDLLTNKGP